ncbi:hypothetical protein [Paraburkholderia acidisoli]|nr:hypothetical protein [Paraburkholderia acidisoli]QGZ66390.1 hypothetical protein FAZ98_31895 [Paraburkholderia acidisoli]
MSEAEIAGYLGFSGPHLAKVKMGKGYLTTDQELVLQRICSNWAIRQYAARRETQLEEMIEKTEPALSPEMQALVSRLVEEQLSQRLETRAA